MMEFEEDAISFRVSAHVIAAGFDVFRVTSSQISVEVRTVGTNLVKVPWSGRGGSADYLSTRPNPMVRKTINAIQQN